MQTKIGNVLGLFDGISCGQLALNRAGITYDQYYASEIDKSAIKVTQFNYPKTIQLGNVTDIKGTDLPQIDLLIGGSPCTSFSSAGKREGFDGNSGLFWEYVRILKETNPKYFLLENVIMKKEWKNIISNALGTDPICINSALVSAQNRNRYYWTNIKVTQPKNKNIKLSDILEDIDYKEISKGEKLNKATITGRRINDRGVRDDYNKEVPIRQCLEVRKTNKDKSNCLTTVDKDNVLSPLPAGRYLDAFKNLPFRYYTLTEKCRLQTLPENYFSDIVSDGVASKLIGNGWTVDVIAHILRGLN